MAPGKAIVISTHLLEEVEAICTRAVIIDQGRIIVDSTPAELRKRGALDDVFRSLTTHDAQRAREGRARERARERRGKSADEKSDGKA
jgi:ABC-2 type transport system ATP-binding protein